MSPSILATMVGILCLESAGETDLGMDKKTLIRHHKMARDLGISPADFTAILAGVRLDLESGSLQVTESFSPEPPLRPHEPVSVPT